jgi:hypothetical protein
MTPIAWEPFDNWMHVVTQSALGWALTVQTTYRMALDAIARKVPGDFVECGVYAGAQSAVMARAIMDSGEKNRLVHLYDSFTGIPAAGPEDIEFLQVEHPEGLSACTLEQVMGNMDAWGIHPELLRYHSGDFRHTVPTSRHTAIAVLRLDGDLYRSTKVCMDHLVPRVSPGGWIIADDFDLSGARKAVLEHNKSFGPMYWMQQC